MNNKIYLCSFASEDLNKSVDRFEFQAKKNEYLFRYKNI